MMAKTLRIDGEDYNLDQISETAQKTLQLCAYTESKVKELQNMIALLTRAKLSYVDELKREILTSKSGFAFDD